MYMSYSNSHYQRRSHLQFPSQALQELLEGWSRMKETAKNERSILFKRLEVKYRSIIQCLENRPAQRINSEAPRG